MNRGRRPTDCCRPLTGNRLERLRGRTAICWNTPSHIMSPARSQPEPSTEVSLGVRGHTPFLQRAHGPPSDGVTHTITPDELTQARGTSKQSSPACRLGTCRRR